MGRSAAAEIGDMSDKSVFEQHGMLSGSLDRSDNAVPRRLPVSGVDADQNNMSVRDGHPVAGAMPDSMATYCSPECPDKEASVFDGSPGSQLTSLVPGLSMRKREGVLSPEIARLEQCERCEVLAWNQGNRRLLVRRLATGEEGWISSHTRVGFPQVETIQDNHSARKDLLQERASSDSHQGLRDSPNVQGEPAGGRQERSGGAGRMVESGSNSWASGLDRGADTETAQHAFRGVASEHTVTVKTRHNAAEAYSGALRSECMEVPADRTIEINLHQCIGINDAAEEVSDPRLLLFPFVRWQAPTPEHIANNEDRRFRLMAKESARRKAWAEKMHGGKAAQAHQRSLSPAAGPSRASSGGLSSSKSPSPTRKVLGSRQGASDSKQDTRSQAPSKTSLPPRSANADFSGTWTSVSKGGTSTCVISQRGCVVTARCIGRPGSESASGLATGKELTMFGSRGTLSQDIIRWPDGSLWTRQSHVEQEH